jgi:threonine dehydratase
MTVSADLVEAAARRLEGVVPPTPLERSERLSALTGAEVWLKREDLQVVRSYKVRGAHNLISQLDSHARAAGVVAASAGNHAQGVAFSCAALGVAGRVYLPATTPRQKRRRIAALGGDRIEVIVHGDTYEDAAAAAHADASRSGATLVPAFDHVATVAGQGTVARELLGQLGRAPDLLVLPVGGGGLLAGTLAWCREHAPSTRVVGVEPAGAACVGAALAAGAPVELTHLDTFVEGAAVRRVGDVPFSVIQHSGAELITATSGQVCSEMLSLYEVEGIIAEPAGALASAGLTGGAIPGITPGMTVVCVVSGGNNDISRYAEIIERAVLHEGRKLYFIVEFDQEPGALRRFLDEVLGPDDDITLFEYIKRNNRETGPALVGIELARPEDGSALLARIAATGLRVETVDPASPLFRFLV